MLACLLAASPINPSLLPKLFLVSVLPQLRDQTSHPFQLLLGLFWEIRQETEAQKRFVFARQGRYILSGCSPDTFTRYRMSFPRLCYRSHRRVEECWSPSESWGPVGIVGTDISKLTGNEHQLLEVQHDWKRKERETGTEGRSISSRLGPEFSDSRSS